MAEKVRVLHFTNTLNGECLHFCQKCFVALGSKKHVRHEEFMSIVHYSMTGEVTCDGLRLGQCHECVKGLADMLNEELDMEVTTTWMDPTLN